MSSKKALVTTNDKSPKEGSNEMVTEANVVKEAITPTIAKKKIDTVNKTDKSKASKRKKDKSSSSNKSDKGKSLDKSRSTQRIET